MPQTHFTNATVAKLSPGEWTDDRYPNLRLRVGKKTRTWMHRKPRLADGSRPGGKLGRFPDLDVAAAVKRYEDERGRLARGEPHPDAAERIRELEAELAAAKRAAHQFLSFGEFVDQFMAKHCNSLAKSTAAMYRSHLFVHAVPAWKEKDADALTHFEIEDLLDKIVLTAPVTAYGVFRVLRTLYRWGVKKDLVKTNPMFRVDQPIEHPVRERVLSRAELRAAWDLFSERPVWGDALKLLTLTWQRRFEVGEMRWTEIEDDWWLLPKERTKTGRRSNLIYLADLAQGLLAKQRVRCGSSKFAFRGFLTKEQPICLSGITRHCREVSKELMKRGISRTRFTVHDLRRTATTQAREQGINRDVASTILNHQKHTVTSIYDLYEMKPEIEAAMKTWNDYLVDLLEIKPSDV